VSLGNKNVRRKTRETFMDASDASFIEEFLENYAELIFNSRTLCIF
jgi:hypothetical protein